MKKLAIGAHVSIAGGLDRAALRGKAAGCDVIQVFTRSNQQWAARPIPGDEASRALGGRARVGRRALRLAARPLAL